MAINDLKTRLIGLLKKYRFAILILLIGIGLMLIPTERSKGNASVDPEYIDQPAESTPAQELEEILRHVDGAGNVKVLLTVEMGEEIIFQTDNDNSNDTDSTSSHSDTVTLSDSGRNEYGLIRQTNPPVYKGAIIVCQGADDPKVQLAIVNAVSKATGLGADRISVLKMK